MFNNFWSFIFKTKEEKMADNNKELKNLQMKLNTQEDTIKRCFDTIGEMQLRMNRLVDSNSILENQLNRLRENIAEDMKYLYEKVN